MNYNPSYKRIGLAIACICLVAVSLNIYKVNTDFNLSDGATFFKKFLSHKMHSYGMQDLKKFKHECIHHKIVELESKMNQPKQAFDETLRNLKDISKAISVESSFQPIRIFADISNVLSHDAIALAFVEKSIVPAIMNFFEETVKVQRLTETIKVDPYYSDKPCGHAGIVIPPSHITDGVPNVDLVYYFKTYREESNTLAYASYCPQGDDYGLASGRPTVAYMNINLKHMDGDLTSKDPMALAKWIFTCIHEVTHSFIFSPNYFDKFLLETNPIEIVNGQSYVVAPSVVKIAQEHFGCSSLTRVPLENEGGSGTAGAHWERKALGNEFMTGSQMQDSVISKFTAQMFIASGWYQINDNMLGTLPWGANEGCEFVDNDCPNVNGQELCVGQGSRCNYDYSGSGHCASDALSNGCSYWRGYSNTRCNFLDANAQELSVSSGGASGSNTRCFDSDLPLGVGYSQASPICLESSCEFSGSEATINFTAHGDSYKCTSSGQAVTIKDKGTVTCPDIYRFCNSPAACPNSCTGRGVCKQGQCTCYKGFSGSDCSTIN